MRTYAGIGSREAPGPILHQMVQIAKWLAENNYWLNSGGARGADKAFAYGAGALKDTFTVADSTPELIEFSAQFHPAWDRCSPYAKKLHARNALIVLGRDLKTPVDFVVCWTKDGNATGGTGQGMRIAKAYNIPIFNLHNPKALDELYEYVNAMA